MVVSERDEHELNYTVVLEEKDDALTRAEKSEARVSYLLSRLQQSELTADDWGWQSSVEEVKTPSSWTELVEWANSGYLEKCLPWLCFTCDWDRALDLDDQNECAWIATTWDIIRTLNDYGRACQDEKISVTSLYNYLKEPPSGYRSVPLRRYKATESESVTNRKRYRIERIFPVPQEIEGRDENGMIYMDKHFVIAKAGMISPRLYCHDGTGNRRYGKVVIGYIGRHLTNDQTN
ncbi:hypothetical protein [Propionibacterium ruminifibrarum]|uniref:hypothetical protein n=1 Tax=Propionibacterium ruminifibrarum TaxID=1962131 RepID=UPI0011C382F3|nr:hypothetical protein [Propionibacterium ruminifibrarum]